MPTIGFWSYVHSDDQAEQGRIVQLAHDIVAQYELSTGDTVDLFLDRDSLEWGDEWRSKIDESLESVAFFVPVLTPRYFKSAECRRELQFFCQRANSLGMKELVMPLLYADVPALHSADPNDPAMDLVRRFQWADWRDLRFADPSSGDYRKGVADLAHRLVDANELAQRAESSQTPGQLANPLSDSASDEPGLLDLMARAEEAMPRWSKSVEEIGEEIERIATIFSESNERLSNTGNWGKSFAGRVTVAKALAQELRDPASRILSLGNEFTANLHTIDPAIKLIVARAPDELTQGLTTAEQVCEFFTTIRSLGRAAREGLGQLRLMVDAIDAAQSLSRDLRPVFRELKQGLTLMIEGQNVTDEWVALIGQSPVKCDAERPSEQSP